MVVESTSHVALMGHMMSNSLSKPITGIWQWTMPPYFYKEQSSWFAGISPSVLPQVRDKQTSLESD
jgi:hypothetical protein